MLEYSSKCSRRNAPLSDVASSYTGTQTGEDTRFKRLFWEFNVFADGWRYMQSAPSANGVGLGREHIVLWGEQSVRMARSRLYDSRASCMGSEGSDCF